MDDVAPGNPAGIRELARHWSQQGDAADSAASTLRSAKDDIEGGALRLRGDFAPKVRDAIGDLPAELQKLAKGYRGCGRALTTFATKLTEAQQRSRRARDDWDVASRDKRNAEFDLDQLAPGWEIYAQSPASLRTHLAGQPEPVLAAATRRENAVRDVDLANTLSRQAAALRGDAEQTCVREIKDALEDSGLKNRAWYQKVGDFLKESFTTWDGFVKLCENVALVLGVVALFLSGPLALIVGAVLLVAAAVVVADKIKKFADGELGWKDLAFELGMVVLARFGGRALGPAFRRLTNSKAVRGFTVQAGKAGQRLANRLQLGDRARNLADRAKCVATGHPVDVATGKVFTSATDLELAGPLPFVFDRVWFSTSTYLGPFGHGWHHSYDAALYATADALLYRTPDGRLVDLMPLYPDTQYYDRQERLAVSRDLSGYRVRDADGNTSRFALSAAAADPGVDVHVLHDLTDRAGHRISLSYDDRGLLTEIVDSGGRALRFEHDPQGRITSFSAPHPDDEDQRFAVVRYAYDEVGNLVSATDALNQQFRYEYDDHLLVRETDRTRLTFHFEYDGSNERARCLHTWGDGGIYDRRMSYEPGLTTVTDSLGHTSRHAHEDGLVVRTVDALGGVTRTEYEYQQPVREIDALGQVTTSDYDYRGNPARTSEPDGATVVTEFDNRDLVLSVIDPLGGQWTWQYSEQGLPIEQRDPTGGTTRFGYRGGMLSTVTDPLGGLTAFDYDERGLLTSITTPDGARSRWRRDVLGRSVAAIDPLGNAELRRFDLIGNAVEIKATDGNQCTLSYDGERNLLTAVDSLTEVGFTYRAMGRLASRSEAGTVLRFEHDTEGQLTGVVNQHGRVYSYGYGPTGEISSERGFDQILRLYERDLLGRPVSVRRASGMITRYEYDAADRVTAVLHSDGTSARFGYRADGALTRAENDDLTVILERDPLGRVVREIQGDQWVAAEYDALGARVRTRSSLGLDQTIQRDAVGNVTGMATDQFEVGFHRDALGQELSRELPGGVRARWFRDRRGRAVRHEVVGAVGTVRDRGYDWDVDGRLRGVMDLLTGPIRYQHDALGQLVSATYPDGRVDLRMPDTIGNLFRTADGGDRQFGPGGQLLSSIDTTGRQLTYLYDAEGNLVGKQASDGERWSYRWRADGNLAEVIRPDGEIVDFGYDALGRRCRKTCRAETTRWVWDRDVPLHEWSGPAQITWLFEPESFVPLARIAADRCDSIVTDQVGTPVAMFDQTGALVWRGDLSPWGELTFAGRSREECPFRWPGQYEDSETGLYYNRFRYYDPEAGQYLSQDPVGLFGGTALYEYAQDPNSWTDPLGLTCVPTSGGRWRDPLGRFARPTPRDIMGEAMRRQGLNPTGPIPVGFKQKFTHGRYDYEARAHPADPGAPVGSNSRNGPTYRVARRRHGTNQQGQGFGWEYGDTAGNWHHTSFLKTAWSDPNAAAAANATHIPT